MYNFVQMNTWKRVHYSSCFREDAYLPLVHLLNPMIRHVGDSKVLFALDALTDIHALAIHYIKLTRKGKINQFPTYPVLTFCIGDKMLVRNHVRHVCDPKYDVTYCRVPVMRWHLELADESGKTYRVNVQDVRSPTHQWIDKMFAWWKSFWTCY